MGNRLTGPGDALKYAQGQTIKHPLGFDIKIDTPLDFAIKRDLARVVLIPRARKRRRDTARLMFATS